MTSLLDLGCFDQAVWGLTHKGFLLNTSVFSQPINWLGFHFHPMLYLFVPFYYLLPTVNWFVFVQSAALSLTALPIFLLAKQVTNSEKQALLWSIIYLINPFVLNADAWDFHPVSFAVPFIAVSFLAIEQQRPLLFALANLTLLLCQEQFGLTVACFGLVYGFKNQERFVSTVFSVLGIIAIVFILTVVMPNFSPIKQHIMFGNNSGSLAHLNRYSWLGHSLKEVVKTLIFSPWHVFKTLFFEFQELLYLKMLLLPVLFTALAVPLFMLPVSADLLVNSLSAISFSRSIYSYHSVTMIPVLTIAALYGGQKISRYGSFLTSLKLTQYICSSSVALGYLFAPLPLPFAKNVWQPVQLMAQYDAREEQIKALVGKSPVSAQANIGAHFSQREQIYLFPNKLIETDYVILWLNSPTAKYDYFSSIQDIDAIGHHLQMEPNHYLSEIEKLLFNKNFNIAYWNDPWLVFKRGPKIKNNEHEIQVFTKINAFRKNLQPLNYS